MQPSRPRSHSFLSVRPGGTPRKVHLRVERRDQREKRQGGIVEAAFAPGAHSFPPTPTSGGPPPPPPSQVFHPTSSSRPWTYPGSGRRENGAVRARQGRGAAEEERPLRSAELLSREETTLLLQQHFCAHHCHIRYWRGALMRSRLEGTCPELLQVPLRPLAHRPRQLRRDELVEGRRWSPWRGSRPST